MILGLGSDIIEVERIGHAIKKHGQPFLDRLFTAEEQKYCQSFINSSQRFAGRFAAKEAVAKALGIGIGTKLGWLDIEIINNPQGKPIVTLSPKAQKQFHNPQLLITISHCKQYATASALNSELYINAPDTI